MLSRPTLPPPNKKFGTSTVLQIYPSDFVAKPASGHVYNILVSQSLQHRVVLPLQVKMSHS